MVYDYQCSKCGKTQEEQCSVDTFKEHKPVCVACGGSCSYVFNPSGVQFVLKDGPSGSWPSKGNRINQQMKDRSKAAARRQRDRYKPKKLIPNVEGHERESWREAQNDVLKEKGPEAASTYNNKVAEETFK